METIYTFVASALVYGWIYGEKTYHFIIGKEDKNEEKKKRAGVSNVLCLRESE